jgi:hypothetical protein
MYKLYGEMHIFSSTKPINVFQCIKILTSIRGCEAETREITLRPKGIERYFFGVQLHSLEVKVGYSGLHLI